MLEFSHDATVAERAFISYLSRSVGISTRVLVDEFNKKFEEGWKTPKLQEVNISHPIFIKLQNHTYDRIAKKEVRTIEDAQSLGYAIGAVIGALRNYPYHIFSSANPKTAYLTFISELARHKREFRDMIQMVVLELENKQQKTARDWGIQRQDEYAKFLGELRSLITMSQ